eukprot:TRINITY_DN3374_c0_g2_i4.p1 TRINITY_DN3374_c0_g2~~TRINITY_DN3374_c0_g2_i4.p1  ORF type:complete len:126 (-),score=24.70 TRINITY_DN3374_c0_g2_i4:19-366(-)
MAIVHGISPTVEHYTCLMDLLGRSGHLDEALQMAKTMPFPPDGPVWLSLLGSCRKWNNVEIGQQAFEFAVSVDGKDAAYDIQHLCKRSDVGGGKGDAGKESEIRGMEEARPELVD